MKLLTLSLSLLFMFPMGCSKTENSSEPLTLKDERDRISYSFGMEIGNNLRNQSLDLNSEALAQGVRDSFMGSGTLMAEGEARDLLLNYKNDVRAKKKAHLDELGEKNKKEGSAFLAENARKEGVVTTSSGLQYKIIKPGTGNRPVITDLITVHYAGQLVDGTEFDSSYKRGTPSDMKLNSSIPGFAEALLMMKEGAIWELYLPPDLAYGKRSVGSNIGPHATLIFKMELLGIKEQDLSKQKKRVH